MLIRFLTPDFEHTDERGGLIQLVHDGWKQVNVITSVKGSFRGGHYHMENTEAFFVVSGSFELLLEEDGKEERHMIQAGTMFMLRPGVVHSFSYTEDTLLVSLYDQGVEKTDGTKDIYTK